MALRDFEKLLRESIGLDVASIGGSAVSRAVQQRQSACELDDPDAYWERARGSETELQELIEAVVVPETWFFRDRPAFEALARFVTEKRAEHPSERRWRVLSLPSSTGEEPYSIAMALLDAGVPSGGFQIDAVDVSARALAQAQHGVYQKNSFRGDDLLFRARYFEEIASGSRLREPVRRHVHFKKGNLLTADALLGAAIYDFVFCRNLLIYFDRPTQDRAITVLERLLAASGVLFVAPSESALLVCHGYVSMKILMASAFRKGRSPQSSQISRSPRGDRRIQVSRNPIRLTSARRLPASSAARVVAPVVAVSGLDEATRLAGEGRFLEATSACEQHVKRCGPSAEAFHVMGLVHDASGDASEAIACYRKALYLEPDHHEVLLHLALLMEKLNKTADAQLLRNRALRVHEQTNNERRG